MTASFGDKEVIEHALKLISDYTRHNRSKTRIAKLISDYTRHNRSKTRIVKYSVDAPPGTIEKRVFIGGNYALMPVLREIEEVVFNYGFQPIIAFDFETPVEKTREYTLRLMFQCKYAIFEMTIPNGHYVEILKARGLEETNILQVYMAMNEKKEPPKTMSVMSWQVVPPPMGYLRIEELKEIVATFLTQPRI